MKKHGQLTFKFLTLTALLVSFCSCSSVQPEPQREVASKNCWDSIRPEYNSYFDSVEKCIENKEKK